MGLMRFTKRDDKLNANGVGHHGEMVDGEDIYCFLKNEATYDVGGL